MNVRRVILIVPCIMSIIGLFLVCFSIEENGVPIDGLTIKLISYVYGIVVAIADALVILFCLMNVKKGFVISSLVSIGVTIYGLYRVALVETTEFVAVSAFNNLAEKVGNEFASTVNYEVVHGPAYFLMIFACILIFVTMVWNALSKDD